MKDQDGGARAILTCHTECKEQTFKKGEWSSTVSRGTRPESSTGAGGSEGEGGRGEIRGKGGGETREKRKGGER